MFELLLITYYPVADCGMPRINYYKSPTNLLMEAEVWRHRALYVTDLVPACPVRDIS
jgi:hypothetical protein